jgi:plastocyanin
MYRSTLATISLIPMLSIGILTGAGEATAAGSGSVKGSVKLTGKAPERKELNMKTDPFCAKQPSTKDEDVMVGPAGQLQNVVVRIAKGVSDPPPPPATSAVLDQVGCMYRPRVVVAQAGQQVEIKNSDATLHNVHTYKGPATLFNRAQPQGMPPIKQKFPTVGDVVKFKCDVHPWMTGYVLVTDSPYFAITAEDGKFEIKDVPAGKYTVEAWHERFGTQTKEVTVVAGKPVELKLEFAAK